MSVRLSTDDLPAGARVEVWEHAVAEHLLPLRGRHDTTDFRARMVAGSLGAMRVVEASTPAGECARPATLIGDALHDLHAIEVVAKGRVMVEQDGRQARLAAGDLAFIDLSRPVRYAATASTHVTVLFPRAMLPMPGTVLTEMTGTRIPGDRGAGALVSTLARQLPRHLDEHDTADEARLSASIVDLIAVALAARADAECRLPAQTRRQALRRQAYAYVDAHLDDPHLSPAAIAASLHISDRYLHRLFESETITVAAWIRQRRLDRCRRDLRDPLQRHRPVAAIAARHGLPNGAHFSRIFKAAYGLTPAEYRAADDPAPR
jgi:AraC-like DNA-binding protein